jgi:tRNA-dihydrouridine synthase A
MRLLSKQAVLYTEMLHARAVVHGKRDRLLRFPDMQHPLVLQLGGSEPEILAQAAKIGEEYGYDEINLNVGCPSERVQSGCFGASLMLEPELTARLFAAMREAVTIPVSVKCRIGVDQQDAEKDFNHFIDLVASSGCEHFVVHARKAWLKGLSPKDNRDVPPLDYDRVRRLKVRRPDLRISLNGGINDLAQCQGHLVSVDGVMVGRAAYHNPYMLSGVDHLIYERLGFPVSRRKVVELMLPHIEDEMVRGLRLSQITRHMIGLYLGEPGARHWRRALGEQACRRGAGTDIVLEAMVRVERLREEAACRG